MSPTTQGRVLRTVVELGVFNLGLRGFGMLREAVVARDVGATIQLDIFLLAFTVFTALTTVIAQPFIGTQLPRFFRIETDRGRAAARHDTIRIGVTWLLLAAGVLALLLLLAPVLVAVIAGSYGDSQQRLMVSVTRVLLIGATVRCCTMIPTVLLHADRRFRLTTAAQSLVPLAAIAAILLVESGDAAMVLAWATLGGICLECVLLCLAAFGRRLPPIHRTALDGLRAFGPQYFALASGAALMSSAALIDNAMAAGQGNGAVTQLSYGNRLPTLVVGVVAAALGTVLLPQFAALDAVGDRHQLRRAAAGTIGGAFAFGVLAATGLVAASDFLVETLFGGGEFTDADVRSVAGLQRIYALQVPFFLAGVAGVRIITAMSESRWLFWISAVNLATNVIGNVVLIRLLGLDGIAWSTVIVYGVSLLLILLVIQGARPPQQ